MERLAERDREMGRIRMWISKLATSHLGLAWEKPKPAVIGWLGAGHRQETLAMSQAWDRAGGWCLYLGTGRGGGGQEGAVGMSACSGPPEERALSSAENDSNDYVITYHLPT